MIEVEQRRLSWNRLILTAAVLSYGFWGYGPSLSKILDLQSEPKAALRSFIFTLMLVFSLVFTIRSLNKPGQLTYVFEKDKNVFIASAVGLIYTALLYPKLFTSNFTGDELSYLQNSFSYAQNISADAARNVPWLRTAPYFVSLSTISLLIACVVYFSIYKALANQRKLNATLIIVLILFLRLCNDYFLHFGSAYPNLYGTFLQSVSYLSVFPIFIRSIQWILISYLLITTFEKFWGGSRIGAYAFAAICLPLLGLSSSWTAIDPSIFFVVCAFSVLSLLIKKPKNYIPKTIMIVSLCTFMRATTIILIPLIVIFSFSEFKKNKINTKTFSPLAVLVPYILESGYENLTSQLQGNRYSDVSIYSESSSPILALIESIRFQFQPAVLVGVLILLLFILAKSQIRTVVGSYLLVIFPIYALMIPNATQGLNKYAIEIVTPLILISLSYILEQILRKPHRFILIVMFILSSFANLVQSSSTTDIDRRVDYWRQVPMVINYPVENYSAYKYLRSLPIAHRCYNPGTTYGVFPFVLSNYNISQIESLNNVFNENPPIFKWGSNQVKISNISAKCLIVDNFPIKQVLAKDLNANGWEIIYTSAANRMGTQVTIWRKAFLTVSEGRSNP
jgi:hypothetical protein